MRRELESKGCRGACSTRSVGEAKRSRGFTCAMWIAPAGEAIGDRAGQDELRSYQIQKHPKAGEYRALIGHKRGAARLPSGAAGGEKPGILGIRAGSSGGEIENERGDISRHEYQP